MVDKGEEEEEVEEEEEEDEEEEEELDGDWTAEVKRTRYVRSCRLMLLCSVTDCSDTNFCRECLSICL